MTAHGRRFRIALVACVCAALLTGGMPSAWAAAADESAPTADLGTFGLGGGLDAVVDPAVGSVRFGMSVGGLALTWDSREVGVDRFGFGGGWSFGLAHVETRGGVRVFPASGGVFEMDATHPSGLLGYPSADVAFRLAEPRATVEGRYGGPAVRYAYVLHELGGTRTYFTDAGDPVVHVAADGARTDWRWVDGFDHRLGAVVDPDGLVTELDWSDPSEVVVRPGANVTAAPDGSGAGGVWRVRLDGGRLDRVTDPVGRETHVGYDRAGLASRVATASGAITVLTWHPSTDGVARVAEVRTHDATGREYLARQWSTVGGVAPSGWPAVGDGAGPDEYSTLLTDGETRVVSTFGEQRAMTGRAVDVASPSGQLRVHEQSFELPETGPTMSGVARKPTGVTVTSRDAGGGVRSVHESYVYDDLGRIVQRSAADGTVTGWEYDSVVPEGALLPVGLPVRETTTAPDGLVASTRSELNAERTAPIVVEAAMGTGDAEHVTARTELIYEGAVVTEQRVFPGGDPAAAPVVTTRTRDVDLDAGTVTVEETAAAGTDAEMTVSSVASLVHGGALIDGNAVGGTSSTRYDTAGRPVGVQDAAGRVTTIAYRFDAARGVEAVATTAPSGVTVTEERDLLGRIVRTYDNVTPAGVIADGHTRVIETHAYPSAGVEEVTDAWGATTRTEHDMFGRPVRIALPNGLVQAVAHDDVAGTVTTGTSPTGSLADAEQTITRRFDAAGRVTGTSGTRADGVVVAETSTEFDGFGRPVTASNGAVRTQVTYDGAGNPVAKTTTPVPAAADTAADGAAIGTGAPAGAELTERRRFDGFGENLEKTLSSGEQAQSGGARELDELGRTVLETDRAGRETRYEYTPDGLVERVMADTGQETSHRYDPATRALLETHVRAPGLAAVTTAYDYDPATGALTGVFDPGDRAATEIRYEYDAHGNVRQVRYPPDEPGADAPRVRHEYDAHGRRTATIDVSGARTTFAYDDTGMLRAVAQTAADGARELARVAYAYDDHGRVARIERGNGVVTAVTYSSVDQVESETTTHEGEVQSARAYEYAPATGNLTSRVDRTRDASGELVAERTEYAYDGFGRLVGSRIRDGETDASPEVSATRYELDVSGAVVSETVSTGLATAEPATPEPATTVRRFAYSAIGELEAITTIDPSGAEQVRTQEYDAAGNLIRGADGSTYIWDAANRQAAQITADGVRIETAYRADGRRKQLAAPSGRTTFFWDGDALLTEQHSSAHESLGSASYLLGVNRHARTVERADGTSETAHYANDRHGNVTDLTNAAGEVTARYAYTDYGVPRLSNGSRDAPGAASAAGDLERNPFGYAGEYTHGDGSQFLRVRTYQPGFMAFSNRDTEPLHTVYGYADANPIMLVDPSGRDAVMDWFSVGLAAAAALGATVGVLALLTGGVSLGAFGVVGAVFGVLDAAFTAYEAWSVNTGTQFMPSQAALGVGIGLAIVGAGFGVGGVVKRTNPDRWTKAFGTDAEVDALDAELKIKAKRAQLGATIKRHVGQLTRVVGGNESVWEPDPYSPLGIALRHVGSGFRERIEALEKSFAKTIKSSDGSGDALYTRLSWAKSYTEQAHRNLKNYLAQVPSGHDYRDWDAVWIDRRAMQLNIDLESASDNIIGAAGELTEVKASPALPKAVEPGDLAAANRYALNELIADLTDIGNMLKNLPRY